VFVLCGAPLGLALSSSVLALAGIAGAAAVGHLPWHLAGSVGVALAVWVVQSAAWLLRRPGEPDSESASEPARWLAYCGNALGALVLCWLFAARLESSVTFGALAARLPAGEDWSLLWALVVLAAATVVPLATRSARATAPALQLVLAVTLLPVAGFDLLGAREHVYPLGFLAVAALLQFAARREPRASAVGLVHTMLALGLGFALRRADALDAWLQTGSFLGVAAVSWWCMTRVVPAKLIDLAALVGLVAIGGAACLGVADGVLGMEPRFQPASRKRS
jgi:hypothetical protein